MYEVHITTKPIDKSQIDAFKSFCSSIHAKPILIELPAGQQQQQPMISKSFDALAPGQIHQEIAILESKFTVDTFEAVRTKVEVPLAFRHRAKEEFPYFHGQYFEWHGKVRVKKIERLKACLQYHKAHISQNALKDQRTSRFITIRGFGREFSFMNEVDQVKNTLIRNSFNILKEEYEYCVFDSNKSTDKGWSDIPEFTDEQYLKLLAFEGFLRRTVDKDNKFILKGSLLTRQYLDNPRLRNVVDLDYIYSEFIDDTNLANDLFSEWMIEVTETELDDGIQYKSFQENKFWRYIDYAMNDDFPTTNTDLSCIVQSMELDVLDFDISWNLPLEEKPVPLQYIPLEGQPFIIPATIPIATQIAWKLHQSIVRPRSKDLLDIILLLESNKLSDDQLNTLSKVFVKECQKDKINPLKIMEYASGKVSSGLLPQQKRLSWIKRVPKVNSLSGMLLNMDDFHFINDIFNMDAPFNNVGELCQSFESMMVEAGIPAAIQRYYTSDLE